MAKIITYTNFRVESTTFFLEKKVEQIDTGNTDENGVPIMENKESIIQKAKIRFVELGGVGGEEISQTNSKEFELTESDLDLSFRKLMAKFVDGIKEQEGLEEVTNLNL